jgi:hypothetical protein
MQCMPCHTETCFTSNPTCASWWSSTDSIYHFLFTLHIVSAAAICWWHEWTSIPQTVVYCFNHTHWTASVLVNSTGISPHSFSILITKAKYTKCISAHFALINHCTSICRYRCLSKVKRAKQKVLSRHEGPTTQMHKKLVTPKQWCFTTLHFGSKLT